MRIRKVECTLYPSCETLLKRIIVRKYFSTKPEETMYNILSNALPKGKPFLTSTLDFCVNFNDGIFKEQELKCLYMGILLPLIIWSIIYAFLQKRNKLFIS